MCDYYGDNPRDAALKASTGFLDRIADSVWTILHENRAVRHGLDKGIFLMVLSALLRLLAFASPQTTTCVAKWIAMTPRRKTQTRTCLQHTSVILGAIDRMSAKNDFFCDFFPFKVLSLETNPHRRGSESAKVSPDLQ